MVRQVRVAGCSGSEMHIFKECGKEFPSVFDSSEGEEGTCERDGVERPRSEYVTFHQGRGCAEPVYVEAEAVIGIYEEFRAVDGFVEEQESEYVERNVVESRRLETEHTYSNMDSNMDSEAQLYANVGAHGV